MTEIRRSAIIDAAVEDVRHPAVAVSRIEGGLPASATGAAGRATFAQSLAALKLCGHLVSFGQAADPIGERDIGAQAARLFAALRCGEDRPGAPRLLPLAQAAEARRLLESRQTTGSLALTA